MAEKAIACGFSIYILFKTLHPYFPQLMDAYLNADSEHIAFFAARTGRIEICRGSDLERVYFRVSDLCINGLSEKTKSDLLRRVRRDTSTTRVLDFFDLADELMYEIQYTDECFKDPTLSGLWSAVRGRHMAELKLELRSLIRRNAAVIESTMVYVAVAVNFCILVADTVAHRRGRIPGAVAKLIEALAALQILLCLAAATDFAVSEAPMMAYRRWAGRTRQQGAAAPPALRVTDGGDEQAFAELTTLLLQQELAPNRTPATPPQLAPTPPSAPRHSQSSPAGSLSPSGSSPGASDATPRRRRGGSQWAGDGESGEGRLRRLRREWSDEQKPRPRPPWRRCAGAAAVALRGGAARAWWFVLLLFAKPIHPKEDYHAAIAQVCIRTPLFYYNAMMVIFGTLGLLAHPLFLCVHLLCIVRSSHSLQNVISALTQHGRALMLTALLGVIVVYLFAVGTYIFFPASIYHNPAGGGGNEQVCSTLFQCFTYTMMHGVRSGGGIGDLMVDPSLDSGRYYWQIVLEFAFYVIVIVFLLNIVFGIIVDTFSELRGQKDRIEEDIRNKCFICGLDASEFERHASGFGHHIKEDHNMWNYVFFFDYLRRKDDSEFTGQESYVAERVRKQDISFFPVGRAVALEQRQKDEQEEADGDHGHLQQRIKEIGEEICEEMAEQNNKLYNDLLQQMKRQFADMAQQEHRHDGSNATAVRGRRGGVDQSGVTAAAGSGCSGGASPPASPPRRPAARFDDGDRSPRARSPSFAQPMPSHTSGLDPGNPLQYSMSFALGPPQDSSVSPDQLAGNASMAYASTSFALPPAALPATAAR